MFARRIAAVNPQTFERLPRHGGGITIGIGLERTLLGKQFATGSPQQVRVKHDARRVRSSNPGKHSGRPPPGIFPSRDPAVAQLPRRSFGEAVRLVRQGRTENGLGICAQTIESTAIVGIPRNYNSTQ